MLTLEELRLKIENVKIKTQSFNEITDYIKSVHKYCDFPKSRMGLITGSAGIGKSKACHVYLRNHPPSDTETNRVVPVVYYSLTGTDSLKDIYHNLCSELYGRAFTMKGTNATRERRTIDLLKERKTELVIIDEAQHFLTAENNPTGKMGQFANTIKTMMDESKVCFVLIGVGGLERLYEMKGLNSEYSEQIRSRSVSTKELKYLNFPDFHRVLKSYTEILRHHQVNTVDLSSQELAARLYIFTGGCLRDLSYLLQLSVSESHQKLQLTKQSLAISSEEINKANCTALKCSIKSFTNKYPHFFKEAS